MQGTIFSIIPPLIMLVLVLLTRKVLPSLGIGILIGALFIHDFNILSTLKEIWYVFVEIFVTDGALNWDNVLLLSFLLLLGIMTALLQASGGSQAFGEWMLKRVKTRTGAQLMTALLGIIIFIDDYFNSLAVGQVARPLTDRHKISRAKLAYFIDSTSAPVTVISPISSWGAYIIGVLASIFSIYHITDVQPLEAFIKMIPLNLYAFASLLLVLLVAFGRLDIGPMKKHEQRALEQNKVVNDEKKIPGDLSDSLKSHPKGKVYHLLAPIIVLIIVTVSAMILTGWQASDEKASILTIFANTDVNVSLFVGGLSAVIVGAAFHFKQGNPKADFLKVITEGLKTMMPAIYILLLAWMIGSIIGTLKTGEYLAGIVSDASISPALLPMLFFLIASVMSLATGTSWGTFGIMLPIAAEVSVNTDMTLLLPTLAAVLAGSVFGDHCTPISDTTILSATGAGVNHIDHVITQLPYAMISALAAGIGYLFIGLTELNILGLILTLVLIIGLSLIKNFLSKTQYKEA